MKKGLCLVAVLSVLLLTGCGDTLTCTNSQDVGTAKLEAKITVTFKSGYATKYVNTTTATFENEDLAKVFADSYSGKTEYEVKQKGKVVTITEKNEFAKEDIKTDSNKKDNVKKTIEKTGYKCK